MSIRKGALVSFDKPNFNSFRNLLFLLFVFFLPFTKLSVPAVNLYEFTLGDFLLVILFLVNILFFRKIKKIFSSYIYAFAIFIISIGVSGFVAKNHALFLVAMIPYAFAGVIIFVTLNFFSQNRTKSHLRYFSYILFFSLFLSALPVYYQIITDVKPIFFYDRSEWRYTFLAVNPNQFGVYMNLYYFILTLLGLKYFKRHLNFIFLMMIFYFPVTLYSGSKTATLIFALNFLVVSLIVFLRSGLITKSIVTPLLIVSAIGISPYFMEFMLTKGNQANRAFAIFEAVQGDRPLLGTVTPTALSIKEGKRMFKNYPIFGGGLANKPEYSVYTDPRVKNCEIHNTYIKFLAETGLVGFLGFLIIFCLPAIVMIASNSSLSVKFSMLIFYTLFAAMNWPHMLMRQRWVWFFMIVMFVIGRINKDGNLERSKLSLFN